MIKKGKLLFSNPCCIFKKKFILLLNKQLGFGGSPLILAIIELFIPSHRSSLITLHSNCFSIYFKYLQRILGSTDNVGTVIRSCKDETFLQTCLLHQRISRICREKVRTIMFSVSYTCESISHLVC